MMRPPLVCPLLAVLLGCVGLSGRADANLLEYVKKPEPKFSWKLLSNDTSPLGKVFTLELVSQEWQGITWTHSLQVYQAAGTTPGSTMLLWNTGGKPNVGTMAFGLGLSRQVQGPVAFLYGIPNQPLFGGKKEDALIAETFVRCLETKDDSWPLLFPMVKSVIKAMDALQAFGKEKWQEAPQQFVIAGASKRGWTTWLTGAADPRVKAIAPVVIDTLNMVEQMANQKKSFGTYSDMIRDYTNRGLVPLPPGEDAKKLWVSVDPYFYRDRLKMPKFIINGNNDPYWTVDALNLYWDKLEGEKYVVYVPNAGHNLKQAGVPPGEEQARSMNALAAFTRHQMTDRPLPKLEWKHDDANGKPRLTVSAAPAPTKARLWVADAATRDFRKSKWSDQALEVEKNKVVGLVEPPSAGFRAFYAEMDYEIDGIRYTLCTQLRVVGN
jgi:PhoPQ-activated pathogenicity-related protein